MTNYETKDSGVRASYGNGGVRDSQEGKARFDLLFPENVPYEDQFLTRFAELMARGAEKYDDRNWEQFSDEEALHRAKSSAMRHMVQWFTNTEDEDHAVAVVFNLMAAEYLKGVLSGKWPAKKAQVSVNPNPLWTGTYNDPEPPAHVKILKRTNHPKPSKYHEQLYRFDDGTWGWVDVGSSNLKSRLREGGGFFWDSFGFHPDYTFEEVR